VSAKGNGSDDDLPAVVSGAPPAGAEPRVADEDDAETALVAAPPPDEAEALRRECEELRDALLRRRAEFENFRRRVERDREAAAAEAEAAILRSLLDTVDNLERALAAGGSDGGLRAGVELTHRDLVALLDSLGVVAIVPLGERFDPALHQAIVHEPAPGFEEGTVAEVYRKGYRYRDRLLRPAMVKVARAGTKGDEDGGESQ